MRTRTAFAAALLLVLSFQAFAGDACSIKSLTADATQIGEPVVIQWSLTGDFTTVTLTGKDFPQPVTVPSSEGLYGYFPELPGEKHLTFTATGPCGTVTRDIKYQVKQCTVDLPVLTVDKTEVLPGEIVQASVVLPPGHTARWEVTGGTPSATTGSEITITAGGPGQMTVLVYVSRGNSCTTSAVANVTVVNPCTLVTPDILLVGPVVATGTVFLLLEPDAPPDADVVWSVSGGRITARDNYTARVVVDGTATSMTVTATISNATCSVTATSTVPVIPCLATATVTAGANPTCDNATVIATFTGTPPFRGTWSDGVPFNTTNTTLVRKVTRPGNYTIRSTSFFDAYCRGTVSGTASLQFTQPSATVTIQSCGIARIALTGTAPFTFTTSFSSFSGVNKTETVTTSEPVYEYRVSGSDAGYFGLMNFRDAKCSGTVTPFFTQYIEPGPSSVTIAAEPACGSEWGRSNAITVHVNSRTGAPFTVTWDDGEVTTGYWPVYRYADQTQTKTYTVTSITSATCGPLPLPANPSVTFTPQPAPYIAYDAYKPAFCPGETAAVSVVNTLPAEAELVWSVQNGTIVSGQGTRRIEFTAGEGGMEVIPTVEARYPSGCVAQADTTYVRSMVYGAPGATITLEPSVIRAGETAVVTVRRTGYEYSVGVGNSLNDPMDPTSEPGLISTYLYRSTHGPGQSIIKVEGLGQCGERFESTATLTINP